jgi:hypothetical protein
VHGYHEVVVEVVVNLELHARPEVPVAAVEVLVHPVEVGGLEDLLEEASGGQVFGLYLLRRYDKLLQPRTDVIIF